MSFKKIYSNPLFKLAAVFFLLYFFLTAIAMMSTAFKLMGTSVSSALVNVTASPVVALFIGILCWLTYGILLKEGPIIISNIVTMVFAGIILYNIIKNKLKKSA